METGTVREFEPGMFSLTIPPCSTAVLSRILDPAVPYVWIVRHWPGSYVHWWRASLPLSETSANRRLRVRDVEFDLQVETSDFLELEPDLRHAGINLLQMHRAVPDTLRLSAIPDTDRYRVLKNNGLHLAFYLPHTGEYANIASPERSLLEAFAARPDLQGPDLP